MFTILLVMLQCSRKYMAEREHALFTINQQCTIVPGEGMDSQIGSVVCGDQNFTYDYGMYSYQGPLTEEEKFANLFKGKYYADFFSIIHIDKKLFRLYIDSVQVIHAGALKSKPSTMIARCTNCNKEALLRFRKRDYIFPYVAAEDEDNKQYVIYTDTIGDYRRKIYISHMEGQSGLFMEPVVRSVRSQKLALYTDHTVDTTEIKKILQSVRLIKNKHDKHE